ncbi:glycosyltransferase, partial [Bacteroidota bacterium]
DEIGLVDSQIINTGLDKSGISIQEKSYISREAKIKSKESIIWGSMMGPFGGCYAVRKILYEKIPPTYLVDDFYINMIVLNKKQKAINDLEAIVYEDVSNDLFIEFKRKIRIATGNFQNLFHFIHLLWPPYKGIAISFLSHKVLRWFGPFFIILIFFSNLALIDNLLYYYFFLFQCFIASLALFDFFMRKIGIHILFLRFITHFLSMNLAMLIGFFRFIIGVKSNVWQPTKRNQG